ncbi:MAG: DUF4129 domain-containing protein [Kineosporiaceae bacterium]
MIAGSAPLTPSRDEARRWVAEQLHGSGDGTTSALSRFLQWLRDLLPDNDSTGQAPLWWEITRALLVIGAMAALIAITARAGAVYRGRAGASGAHAVLDDLDSSAEDHRRAADAHAALGDWGEAVVERYRAITRQLQDRGIVAALPGLTAHEVADAAAARLPDLAAALSRAAAVFDDVRYGDQPATGADDAALRELDDAVTRATPSPATAATPGLAVPR